MSFIGQFTKYVGSRTDAPSDWAVSSAIAAISAAVGSNVHMNGRGGPVYLNTWNLNIGKSGMGKSVAPNMVERLLRLAGLGPRIIADSFSLEAMYDLLKSEPNRIFIQAEFSAFLEMLQKDYNAGALQTLTHLYDVPQEYVRRVRPSTANPDGEIKISMPCVTILAATAPDWFAEQFQSKNLRGGFYSRIMYCPRDKRGQTVDDPGPFDERLDAILSGHLRAISEQAGLVDFRGVQDDYNRWDRKTRDALDGAPPEFAGLRSRQGTLVKKLSAVFRLSEDPTSLVVLKMDLDRAITYVERVLGQAEDYLSTKVAHNRHDATLLRIMEIIEQMGDRAPRSKVMQNGHLGAREMSEAILSLEQQGRIRTERTDSGAQWLVKLSPRESIKVVGA